MYSVQIFIHVDIASKSFQIYSCVFHFCQHHPWIGKIITLASLPHNKNFLQTFYNFVNSLKKKQIQVKFAKQKCSFAYHALIVLLGSPHATYFRYISLKLDRVNNICISLLGHKIDFGNGLVLGGLPFPQLVTELVTDWSLNIWKHMSVKYQQIAFDNSILHHFVKNCIQNTLNLTTHAY